MITWLKGKVKWIGIALMAAIVVASIVYRYNLNETRRQQADRPGPAGLHQKINTGQVQPVTN